MRKVGLRIFFHVCIILGSISCAMESVGSTVFPHNERWGIYWLELADQEMKLIYSSSTAISNPVLHPGGERLLFSRNIGGESLNNSEIFSIKITGEDEQRLTDNAYLDTYPVWSPDGGKIAYLSWPDRTLDIYLMDTDGGNNRLLYDSGSNDADIDWEGDEIVFTRDSRIWIMNPDGTNARAVTDPPRAGIMGKANLPFGDYDPRINPVTGEIVFERLLDDRSAHGNYDLFKVKSDGTGLISLTSTGYTQGLADWSPSGEKLIFIVTAIEDAGRYDLYLMNSDGSGAVNITPKSVPANVLIHAAIFSKDDALIYFVAEWWE